MAHSLTQFIIGSHKEQYQLNLCQAGGREGEEPLQVPKETCMQSITSPWVTGAVQSDFAPVKVPEQCKGQWRFSE